MKTELFDYRLPEESIAQEPLGRGQSRLLVADAEGESRHLEVAALPELLEPDDLVVSNNTRVLPARIFGASDTGGRIELLLVEKESDRCWLAMARPGKRARPNRRFSFDDHLSATARGRSGDLYRFEFDRPVEEVLEKIGHMPLPPYIRRNATPEDQDTYQTIFARHPGAVAAPTAGLHFSESMLHRLDERGIERVEVTLHVGLGTFKPVTVDNVMEHHMHSERFSIPKETCAAIERARERGGRVVAIGTTVVRCLESAATEDGRVTAREDASTELFITPGYRYRVVDALLTNFHLPRSTLLMMVCAFAGTERVLRLYQEAIENDYRFYSYGDAMFVDRA